MNKPYLDYNKSLQQHSLNLRNQSTFSDVLVSKNFCSNQMMGFQFNRQLPQGKFIADLYCKPLKPVVDIDARRHEWKGHYVADRDVELQKQGLTVLHYIDQEVKTNINAVLVQFED